MNVTPNAPATTPLTLQWHLDEADGSWFARNPGARHRIRMYIPGESVEPGEHERFIVVTLDQSGELRWRFLGEGMTS